MTPCGRSCHSLCICAVNSPVSRDRLQSKAFPACPRHALLAKDLVTWQAMVGRHILEDIVGRVAHCQSALKDHKDDRVSQEIAPHTVTPCEIAVCRSTINAGSDRWPVRLQTRAVVYTSSSLRLNRDSSLKMTRLQSVTLQVARGRQNPVDTAYDVGVSGIKKRTSEAKSVSRLFMVSLDGTGCLEGGKWR
ncbi:hypothetical protein TNCV_2057931 [Trichonephila clavipes]|nr:hypothetical protein TNCV_2057931 [Trichonephila clavipes]